MSLLIGEMVEDVNGVPVCPEPIISCSGYRPPTILMKSITKLETGCTLRMQNNLPPKTEEERDTNWKISLAI